jgi:hypothetical protein
LACSTGFSSVGASCRRSGPEGNTFGPGKEGSTFTYRGEVGLSPLIGVCGETGDVLAIRARVGNAHPGRASGGFIKECAAPPARAARNDHRRVHTRDDSVDRTCSRRRGASL